ncbi:MAG: hypothetical protein JF614_25755 [Acidobacteria bacterium]|nr:hypothetical protein [Acidobacteriota bacterium]
MRKKMLLLGLAMAAVIGALSTPGANACPNTSCPICTTYADGSECCVGCICCGDRVIACTNVYCPPPDGEGAN